MKAMIFAAGLGTRLKPLTDTLPKALVPVAGRPLLEHTARRLMASGISECVVNVHHFADLIEEWIGAQEWICTDPEDMKAGMMLMQVSDERRMLLETGGAVFHARRYLEGCGRFLIHNVDILSDCNLEWFCSQVRPDALGTLLVSERESSRCFLFEPQTMRLVGWANKLSGDCIMISSDISQEDCLAYAFSGIHILSDKVFDLMAQYVEEKKLTVVGADVRFAIRDFYLWVADRQPVYGVVADNLRLLDVGKLDAIAPAEELVGL